MKKRLFVLLLLLLMALALAACDNDDGEDDNNDEQTTQLSADNRTETAVAALPTNTEAPPTETTAPPTDAPTDAPTNTVEPSEEPTEAPTDAVEPTDEPTSESTAEDSETPVPTEEPTEAATNEPRTVDAGNLVTLTIGTTDEISKLDPSDAYSFHDWEILRNVSEGLVGYVPGTTDIEPRLALALPTVSDDGLVYTFQLRKGVKFPDGTELTAQMVVDWATRSLTLQGDPYGLISVIESVAVGENEDEIVFTLKNRFDLFPVTIAAQPQLMPFAAGNFPMDAFNNQPEQIQGVGPYSVVSYVIGEQTILEANPNYYGEKPAYDRVVIAYYQDAPQLTLAIENGDIDMAWRSVTATEVPRLSEIGNLEVLTLAGPIQYLLFNHQSEIGGNADIRRAIAKLVDRDEIVDRALSGLADPLYSMVPEGFSGANESFLETYGFRDIEGAQADLTAAGYSEENKLVLDLWYPPERYGTEMPDAVTIIKQQLEESGMIEVNLQSVEWTTYVSAATDGEYPFYVLGWFFDFPDADNYLHPFASCEGSPGLGANYCNEQMEALISRERSLIGDEERVQAIEDVQNFYAQEVVSVPIWVRPNHMVYDTSAVTGVIIGAPLIMEYRLLRPA